MAKFKNFDAELARNGLNVGDVADYMGKTKQTIYGKMSGKIAITQDEMKSIQNFFSEKAGGTFTLDYLFATED